MNSILDHIQINTADYERGVAYYVSYVYMRHMLVNQ